MKAKSWQCTECKQISKEVDLLTSQNPFDPQWEIIGCPHCFEVNHFDEICEVPQCKNIATTGFPFEKGYMRACYTHYKKYGN